MDPVNWGILGAAKFAREQMAPAIHASSGARLAAVATSDPAKAAPFEAFAPGLAVHQDYDAMLSDPSIDAVYIPLPNHLHVEWTIKALEAGKHALVEKPASLTVAEHDALIAARDASGKLAAEAYMIVHHPQWHRARAMVADGAIGALRHVSGSFTFFNDDMDNIRNRQGTGGGALRDIGVYILGSARYVTGAEFSDLSGQMTLNGDHDTTTVIQGRLGDVTYAAHCSTRMHLYQEMVFHGEAGRLRMRAPFNPGIYADGVIEVDQPNQGTRLERFTGINQYVRQVEAFCETVRNGADYPCPLEFTRGTQAAIDQILEVATPL